MKFRGMFENIADETKEKYSKITGVELDVTALRLLPYLLDRAMNSCGLDKRAIKEVEVPIIKHYTQKKLCECYPYNIRVNFCNKEFYKIVCQILYEGYIDLYREEEKEKIEEEKEEEK